MNREPAHSISKRGRLGEGRPTKRTPEVVAKIAEAIAIGVTDEEASLLAAIDPDTMTEWRKDPEFSGAVKKATAQRLLLRLERIEAGVPGWQGTAWAPDGPGGVPTPGRLGDAVLGEKSSAMFQYFLFSFLITENLCMVFDGAGALVTNPGQP
jgi:hypothetical protein